MEENKLKIKYNVKLLKWTLTIFFLLGNLLFCAYEKEDMVQFLCFGIVINFLAIFSFVILSIFPRIYFVFDENGCSYQDSKGNEKDYVSWDNVKKLSYIYVMGVYPEGLEIEYKPEFKNRWISIAISPKQARLVYNTFPKVKELIDKRAL